jgi:hypothetical protein
MKPAKKDASCGGDLKLRKVILAVPAGNVKEIYVTV